MAEIVDLSGAVGKFLDALKEGADSERTAELYSDLVRVQTGLGQQGVPEGDIIGVWQQEHQARWPKDVKPVKEPAVGIPPSDIGASNIT